MKTNYAREMNLSLYNHLEMNEGITMEMNYGNETNCGNEPMDLESEKIVEMNPISVKLSKYAKSELTRNIREHHRFGELQMPHIEGITITLDEKLPPMDKKEECYLTPDGKMQVLGVRVGKELYEELKNRFMKKEE